MATPLISIGLPVYNGQNFIAQAIESLLAQDLADFELIVSDNASTDGTEEICCSLAKHDARIRYLRSDRNRGAAWNFNHTFELARGQYFKWAAHDDVCMPTFLSSCLRVLKAGAGVAVAYPRLQSIDADGNKLPGDPEQYASSKPRPHQRFKEAVLGKHHCYAVFGVVPTEIMRRTRLIGPYVASDRVLLAELSLLGQICQVPEPLFLRRVHAGVSTTANETPLALTRWFDTSRDAKVYLPTWRVWWEHCCNIRRAPLGFAERAICDGTMVRYLWQRRYALWRETKTAAILGVRGILGDNGGPGRA